MHFKQCFLGSTHILRNHFCDFKNVVDSGHKQLWRPPAANMILCDLKNVVAPGQKQPMAAFVRKSQSVTSRMITKYVNAPLTSFDNYLF